MNALVSGFYIGGEPGRELAQVKELKDSDVVWSIPIFLLSFLDNPAPLLLYDKILIDDRIPTLTIDYLSHDNRLLQNTAPEQREVQLNKLDALFRCELFRNLRFETILSRDDLSHIRQKARLKIENRDNRFSEEVDELKLLFGAHYAAPDPLKFEAMNTELIWQVSEKLCENDAEVSILDDCARGKIYRSKVYELVCEQARREVASKFLNGLPTYVAGLPRIQLESIDSFLDLHQNNDMKRFREIITSISMVRDERQRDGLIKNQLYKANEQALKSVHRTIDKINLFGLVLGLGSTSISLATQTSWLAAFGFASSTLAVFSMLKQAWDRYSYRQRWNWFVRLKSFAEQQAGFDQQLPNPWPLSEL